MLPENLYGMRFVCFGFGLNLSSGIGCWTSISSNYSFNLSFALFLQPDVEMATDFISSGDLDWHGTSILGSAIAATAPIIKADDEDVAQTILRHLSFNVFAALVFPTLATWLGFRPIQVRARLECLQERRSMTSSVTATATTWDSLTDWVVRPWIPVTD